MDSYPCIKCGLCCKRVDVAAKRAVMLGLEKFPFNWDETGKCEMLGDDNLCKVYDSRPLICNIDRIAELYELDKKSFYNQNIESCNMMLEEANRTERIESVT